MDNLIHHWLMALSLSYPFLTNDSMLQASHPSMSTRRSWPLPSTNKNSSNHPLDAFSNSPSSVASPLPIIDVDDLIKAFLDSACGTSLIYSGSPESDSCSLTSTFSDLPTHDPHFHHISINSHSPLHPTDENATKQINGNFYADDEQGSPYSGENHFSLGFNSAPITTAVDPSDSNNSPLYCPQSPTSDFDSQDLFLLDGSNPDDAFLDTGPISLSGSYTIDSSSLIPEENLVLSES